MSGIAGELDRLDRSAPRGRSVVERSLRAFLEGARSDVLARKSTTRLRAAQALLRLAEDGAELVVERVEDALAPVVEEQAVDVLEDTGSAVVVEPVDGLSLPDDTNDTNDTDTASVPDDEPEQPNEKKKSSKKQDDKKKTSKKDSKKKDSKKKDSKKKDGKKGKK